MTTRRSLSLLFCGAVGVFLATLSVYGQQKPASTNPADYQKVVLDNQFVRVLDIRLPPGTFESKHGHPKGLQIALSEFENEAKVFPSGVVTRRKAVPGEVRWNDVIEGHEVTNVGTTEQHVIRIELK